MRAPMPLKGMGGPYPSIQFQDCRESPPVSEEAGRSASSQPPPHLAQMRLPATSMQSILKLSLIARYSAFALCIVLALLIPFTQIDRPLNLILFAVFCALSVLGVFDLIQRRHAITRNYPVIGHVRFLVESVRPELRQYLF